MNQAMEAALRLIGNAELGLGGALVLVPLDGKMMVFELDVVTHEEHFTADTHHLKLAGFVREKRPL